MFANAKRRLVAVLAGVLCVFMLAVTPAYAAVKQVGTPTTSGFTISWDKWSPSSSSYSFKNYQVFVGKNSSSATLYRTIDSADITTCNVTGLPAGAERYVQVKANYIYTSSYDGKQTEYNSYVGSLYDAKTVPGAVKGLKQDRWYYFILEFNAKWKAVESADGYEWICYKDNGRKFRSGTLKSGSSTSVTVDKIKNNQIYKMKVRAYTTINGTKYYGAWSSFAYFFTQPRVTRAKVVSNKIVVRWGKVAGATGYTVYASTKSRSGYKKIATVSKGRSSLTIKKIGTKKIKNGKKYYVYVVTNKKVRGKNNTSGRLYYWNTKDTRYGYF